MATMPKVFKQILKRDKFNAEQREAEWQELLRKIREERGKSLLDIEADALAAEPCEEVEDEEPVLSVSEMTREFLEADHFGR